jgi:hypothetical protein
MIDMSNNTHVSDVGLVVHKPSDLVDCEILTVKTLNFIPLKLVRMDGWIYPFRFDNTQNFPFKDDQCCILSILFGGAASMYKDRGEESCREAGEMRMWKVNFEI